MSSNEIHVGDIGTNFNLTVRDEDETIVDISNAVNYDILFRKPDGTVLTKDAVFITDGTDGQMRYTSIEGDLDMHGNWSLQAFVDFGATEWYSDIYKFKVYKNVSC